MTSLLRPPGETTITRPHRIAVVGLGKIATDQHLPAIAASADFELAATLDPRQQVARVPAFASLDELLASGTAIDAVAICTPPQVRAGLAACAIDAGLAVLLEKPPAATVAEVGALDERARARGVTLFAAWHSRFAPRVAAAQAWLQGRDVVSGRIV